jgi:Integrase core domain
LSLLSRFRSPVYRLPLCAAGDYPAPDPFIPASLLQRHGISRLPEVEGDKPAKRKLKSYPIGYFHIDIAEVQTAEGKLYLYVAIDRTSKFAFVQLVKTGRTSASAFLEALIAAVPYKIHIVLTDNGVQFTFHRATQTAPPRVT